MGEQEALNYLATLSVSLRDIATELAKIRKLMEEQHKLASKLCEPAERALELMYSSSEEE